MPQGHHYKGESGHHSKAESSMQLKSNVLPRQNSEENGNSNTISAGQSGSSILEQEQSPVHDRGVSHMSTAVSAAPLCRQFWKSGNYNDGLGPKVTLQSMHLLIASKMHAVDATT